MKLYYGVVYVQYSAQTLACFMYSTVTGSYRWFKPGFNEIMPAQSKIPAAPWELPTFQRSPTAKKDLLECHGRLGGENALPQPCSAIPTSPFNLSITSRCRGTHWFAAGDSGFLWGHGHTWFFRIHGHMHQPQKLGHAGRAEASGPVSHFSTVCLIPMRSGRTRAASMREPLRWKLTTIMMLQIMLLNVFLTWRWAKAMLVEVPERGARHVSTMEMS